MGSCFFFFLTQQPDTPKPNIYEKVNANNFLSASTKILKFKMASYEILELWRMWIKSNLFDVDYLNQV